MPFMLQSCGHALRFMTADGICRRCSMDVNGVLAGPESESPSETMVLDKAASPTAVAASSKEENTPADPDAFCRQVEKLVGVLINSDGTEISDAVQHVARAMSTFTAVERADFITHLIVMYCEARREDQPKIILLIKELSKKNVLARTHFLQSAKKLTGEIPQLTVDWPNIYDCSTFLVYTCLEIIDKSTESLRSFENILARAPAPHASKFLDGFHRFCHLPPEGTAMSPRKSITADTLHNPRQTLPFFRSPEAARDRLMRPLSQIDVDKSRQRVSYSREVLLEIERAVKGRPVPIGLVERLAVVMGEGKKEEREGFGKRPRYVSESAVGNDMGSKRLLESTSPVLAGEGMVHGRPHFEKFAPTPRVIILPPRNETADQHHPSHSPVKHARDYYNQPARQDFQRSGPTNENIRPGFHQQQQHPPGQFVRPHFRSSASVSEGAGDMGQPGYRRQTMGGVKTKKFLTALSIERDSDAGPESPPVTLAPGERTWARGSGSLKPLSQQRKNTDDNWRRAAP